MKLTESCVIAALIVCMVRGRAKDTTVAPQGRDRTPTSCYQLIWKTPTAELFRSTCLEAARSACPQLAVICAGTRLGKGHSSDTPRKGQDADVVLPIDLENANGRAFSINMLGSGQECLPSACCDTCGAMGSLRHEVLAAMRRWLDC